PLRGYDVTLAVHVAGVQASAATIQTANVPSGGTATTSFTVSCAATTTTGTLTVSNSTTDSNLDPDGYTVTVSGSAGTGSQTMARSEERRVGKEPTGRCQVKH